MCICLENIFGSWISISLALTNDFSDCVTIPGRKGVNGHVILFSYSPVSIFFLEYHPSLVVNIYIKRNTLNWTVHVGHLFNSHVLDLGAHSPIVVHHCQCTVYIGLVTACNLPIIVVDSEGNRSSPGQGEAGGSGREVRRRHMYWGAQICFSFNGRLFDSTSNWNLIGLWQSSDTAEMKWIPFPEFSIFPYLWDLMPN